jgi:Lrp/AsnC family leucine-responsive transcriptional regulator
MNQLGACTLENERLLDEVNWQILSELQEDARLSYTELGRRVGLTAPAVAERVKRLEESGVIAGYRVDLNLEKVGYPLLVYIRLATNENLCMQFGAIAQQFPEVIECHRVTGGDSYIVQVAVSSVRHLELFLNRIQHYGQTVTSIVLSSTVTKRIVGPPEPEAPREVGVFGANGSRRSSKAAEAPVSQITSG